MGSFKILCPGVSKQLFTSSSSFYFFKDFIYFGLERREGREKGRERNTDVREIH